MNSLKNEQGRPNASGRGAAGQAKRVKPVGIVQRAEQFSMRTRRKSSAKLSVPILMNRRMRTRMSGGVRGGG